MNPKPFALERYFARHEFTTRYLLCSSDPETMRVEDLLALEPQAAGDLMRLWLGYTQSKGDPALRERIAALHETISADQVLVHAGAQEPIFCFMHAALRAGDHLVVQTPSYQSHTSVAESIGAEVSAWNDDLDAVLPPDPAELEALIRPTTRAIVLTTPNNPTGATFDRERLDATIAVARKHGLWIFADQVYRGSERAGTPQIPAVCDAYERGITLGGMAKVYGLPGLRIGWIATRDEAIYREIECLKDYLTICNPAPSELLALVALRHGDALIARTQRTLVRNLDLLDAFFDRHRERFVWRRPPGGTTAFPRVVGTPAQQFCAELVERAGVLLLPSAVFDLPDDRVRVGYGRENLPEALAALEAFLITA